jgi:hypothetical protein
VDYRDDFLNQRLHSILNCPTSLSLELTKQLQWKGNTTISWGNQ